MADSAKYLLIKTHNAISIPNILGKTEIGTEQFPTIQEARDAMYAQLRARVAMDDPECVDELMALLLDEVEISNMALHKFDAYVFQNQARTSYFWKIVCVI